MGTRHLLSFMKCRRPEPIPVSEVRKMVLSSTLPSHAIPTPARPTTGSTTPVQGYPLGKVKTVRSRCSRIARARQIESSFGGLPLRSPVYRRSCWGPRTNGRPGQFVLCEISVERRLTKRSSFFFSLPNPRLVFFFLFSRLFSRKANFTPTSTSRESVHINTTLHRV